MYGNNLTQNTYISVVFFEIGREHVTKSLESILHLLVLSHYLNYSASRFENATVAFLMRIIQIAFIVAECVGRSSRSWSGFPTTSTVVVFVDRFLLNHLAMFIDFLDNSRSSSVVIVAVVGGGGGSYDGSLFRRKVRLLSCNTVVFKDSSSSTNNRVFSTSCIPQFTNLQFLS